MGDTLWHGRQCRQSLPAGARMDKGGTGNSVQDDVVAEGWRMEGRKFEQDNVTRNALRWGQQRRLAPRK
eukprot:782065-Pelagomonas_calceolata.AAC.4